MGDIKRTELRIELLRRGLTQTHLAQKLGVPLTTLSSWLSGAHPTPAGLGKRIDNVLADIEVKTNTA